MNNLRLVHIPQVGYKARMEIAVKSVEEGIRIADVLAYYDLMQYDQNIKGDYSNVTLLEEYDKESGEWFDYYNELGESFEELREHTGFVPKSGEKHVWKLVDYK